MTFRRFILNFNFTAIELKLEDKELFIDALNELIAG